jgi:hypothetical protein
MNRRLAAFSVAVLAVVFIGGTWAQAQAPLTKIGFGFFASGREFASGKYAVDVTAAGKVSLKAEKGKAAVEITPLKSLGPNPSLKAPKLVFEVVGADRFLAEVWLPGHDGYLVGSVSGDHTEQVVEGPAPIK